jgi:hypothetical protein
MTNTKTPALRLPRKLAYTAMHCAIAGTLACSGHVEEGSDAAPPDGASDVVALDGQEDAPQDASRDAGGDVVIYDAQPDCGDSGYPVQCGPPGAPCAGWICGFDCPSGCEPYI